MRAIVIGVAASLAACAPSEPPKVEIKGDTYCEIAEKVRWSRDDTVETVRQVVRENEKHDRVCGVRVKVAAASEKAPR
jgi:hypothetical protein